MTLRVSADVVLFSPCRDCFLIVDDARTRRDGMSWGDVLMGYSCILFLFWVFAPFIVAFSAVAQRAA